MGFIVGQRVISKRHALLGGYYGHIIDMEHDAFIIVHVSGCTSTSSDRHANQIGQTFPFMPDEIEAAD